jgi:hypothetical protein
MELSFDMDVDCTKCAPPDKTATVSWGITELKVKDGKILCPNCEQPLDGRIELRIR